MTLSDWIASARAQLDAANAQSPVVRWSLVAIAVLVAWFWVAQPLIAWKADLVEQAERTAEQAVRLAALKERAEDWVVAEQRAQQAYEESFSAFFLQASSAAAHAELQELITRLCAANNITIESQRLLPVEPTDFGEELVVAFNLRGGVRDIFLLIDQITRGEKLVVPRELLIRANMGSEARVQLLVAGFRPQ